MEGSLPFPKSMQNKKATLELNKKVRDRQQGAAGLGGSGRRLPRLWSSWEPTAERLGEELTLPVSRELR